MADNNDITITTTAGTNPIEVTVTEVGPAGTGLGITLHDYAIKGQVVSWTGAQTVNLDNGNSYLITLTGNVTLSLSGWPATGDEGKVTLYLVQGSGAPHLVTWPVGVKWLDATAPVLSLTETHSDVVVFTSLDAGTTVHGFHIGNFQ